MSHNNRARGRRAELALRDAMNRLTTVPWHTTAQRSGKHTGDVASDGVPIHFEVKARVARLQNAYAALVLGPFVGDGLVCCPLERLLEWRAVDARGGNVPATLKKAMRQAERDRNPDCAVLVAAKLDGWPWIACYRESEESRLMEILGKIWK